MQSQAVEGLEIVRVGDDRDLEAMIAVRVAADPDRTPPRIENLRHHLKTQDDLTYLVARLEGEPVACGFVQPFAETHAEAHFVVVPAARRRGIGSTVLAEVGSYALAAGRGELQGEVREDDDESQAFFERRGYRVVGGEKAVALELAGVEEPVVAPPPGVRIVSREERPDLLEELYPIGLEALEDIPGTTDLPSFELWRAIEVDRPTRIPELFFVAVADNEPVGYATMDDFGRHGHHGLTAVKRAWRRRGIATALKRAQIAAAKERGFERLVTGSEERNVPMRNLNAKLGYRPTPRLSVVVVRGPADVRSPHGDG
jgi:GNAT superfamily N-acetyltransferase